jgi:hypothetical protein
MLFSPRHSRHSLAIALLLASSIVSCTSLHHRPFDSNADLDDISGVTTRSGTEIPFAKSSASIRNDTLYALGERGPLKMPTDSIARVSKRKVSVWRTAALSAGIGAAAIVALGVAFWTTLDFNQT